MCDAISVPLSFPQTMMPLDSHCSVQRKEFRNIKHLGECLVPNKSIWISINRPTNTESYLMTIIHNKCFLKTIYLIHTSVFQSYLFFIFFSFLSFASQVPSRPVDLEISLEGNVRSLKKFLGIEKCLVGGHLPSISTTHTQKSWQSFQTHVF